jgi:hypothetical protein
VPGAHRPHPGGQFRRHVYHRLAVGDQPLGQLAADPVRTLYRPQALWEPAADRSHLPVPGVVIAEHAGS